MKRFYQIVLVLSLAFALWGCAGNEKPETPFDTLRAYNRAIKEKNPAAVKSLFSRGSLKMAGEEAKSQNVSLDEVLQRETLFLTGEKSLEFRNEKIEGETATIEIKTSYGTWDVVLFVKEEGKWKIAKERYADELMKQSEEDNKRLDEQINKGREP